MFFPAVKFCGGMGNDSLNGNHETQFPQSCRVRLRLLISATKSTNFTLVHVTFIQIPMRA